MSQGRFYRALFARGTGPDRWETERSGKRHGGTSAATSRRGQKKLVGPHSKKAVAVLSAAITS